MIRALTVLMLVVLRVSSLHADFGVIDKGVWPKSWPKELEPLRKQASTYEGPMLPQLHYAIPFKTREEFETAWPHLLKLKSKGAPIVLHRKPTFFLGEKGVGVCIHTPPAKQKPVAAEEAKDPYSECIYIELVVDGEIVDLNRIYLPPETPIVDQRFGKQ